MTLILKSFICYINCQLFGNVFCGLELVDLCRGCLWLVFSNPVYGCVVCVTCYTQVHTYMLWHVCQLCVRDCKWDSVPFPGFFLILLFSMCLFFYHLHSRLQSLMWFQPAHHSCWLLQHLSSFGARVHAVPTLCVDVLEKTKPWSHAAWSKEGFKMLFSTLGQG